MTVLYGYYDHYQWGAEHPVEGNEPVLVDIIEDALRQHNEMMAEMLRTFVSPVTTYQEYFQPGSSGYLQEHDEYGRPLPTRLGPGWSVAYPMRLFGDNKGWTDIAIAKLTMGELSRQVSDAMAKDYRTMIQQVRRAVFNSSNWTYTDEQYGSLTIRRLCNADGMAIPDYYEDTFDGDTHTHYITSGAAALADGDIKAAVDLLAEHGLNGDIRALFNKAQETAVKDLSDFTRTYPAKVDPGATAAQAIGLADPDAIGWCEDAEIALKPWIPAGYFFVYDAAGEPPLGMREETVARLRGFHLAAEEGVDAHYPLRNRFFRRLCGFGGRHRLNGVCVEITADAAYDDPTGI